MNIYEQIEEARDGATPGPWTTTEPQRHTWVATIGYPVGPNGNCVALVADNMGNETEGLAASDARLIALAPTMADMLLDAQKKLEAAERLAGLADNARSMVNRAFGAGMEEREGGSWKRQQQASDKYEAWLAEVDAALAAYREARG